MLAPATTNRHAEAATSFPGREASTSNVKGAGIKAFFEWYSKRPDSLAPEMIARRLDTGARAWFDFSKADLGMLSASWYPAPAIHALLDVILAGMSADEGRRLARDAAVATVRSHLSGLYRYLFKAVMSPKRYARSADQIFHRYYDSGVLTKKEIAPGRHVTIVRDWPGHHRFFCDLALYASEVIYPEMGYRLIELERTACVSDGDADCRWIAAWEA